jgi:hypothetical protein
MLRTLIMASYRNSKSYSMKNFIFLLASIILTNLMALSSFGQTQSGSFIQTNDSERRVEKSNSTELLLQDKISGLNALVNLGGAHDAGHAHDENCVHPFSLGQRFSQIEYGNSINFSISKRTDANASWFLIKDSKVLRSGSGDETGDIVFDKPGNYQLIFSTPASGKQPAYAQAAQIEVLPVRIKFRVDQAKLNSKLHQGVSLDGATLSIPVEVNSYNGEPVKYGPYQINSTGASGITAIFPREVSLAPGTHNLVFNLAGVPQQAAPAQLGFFSQTGEGYFYNFLIAK